MYIRLKISAFGRIFVDKVKGSFAAKREELPAAGQGTKVAVRNLHVLLGQGVLYGQSGEFEGTPTNQTFDQERSHFLIDQKRFFALEGFVEAALQRQGVAEQDGLDHLEVKVEVDPLSETFHVVGHKVVVETINDKSRVGTDQGA